MPYDREEHINEVVSTLMRTVNSLGLPTEEIAQRLTRQHRTLQQSFMRLCVDFIKAEAENSFDLRNEQAVRFAKAVVENVDHDTMLMPLV